MILCLGDSITYGTYLSPAQAWPALIGSTGPVVNAGVGGSCIAFSSFDHPALEHFAPMIAARLHPDIVFVAAGMNDLIRTDDMSVVTSAACRLTARLFEQGTVVRWCTTTPLAQTSTWAAELQVRRLRWLDWMRVHLADGLIDWEGQLRDGASPWLKPSWDIGGSAPSHPNAIGQQRLADFLLAEL